MSRYCFALLGFGLMTAACGCSARHPTNKATATYATAETFVPPTAEQIEIAARVGIGREELTKLVSLPLYKMQPREVDHYLAYLQATEPSLRNRVAMLARKNIGQPYELYLLGEYPYQVQDDQPLFSLAKSDCVVFVEHTYAMAMSRSWEEFFWVLQRIRYRGGVIGVATRNHYTETDWIKENAWLVTDVSAEVEGHATYNLAVDRQKFLRNRYNVDAQIPVENSVESYVPQEAVTEAALSKLNQGDYVNIISAKPNEAKGGALDYWASHVGMVVIASDGKTRHVIHSSEPHVREETFDSFINRAHEREARNEKAGKKDKKLAGFKFLKLVDAPEVPPMQPQPRPTPPTDRVWTPPPTKN